MRTTTRGRGKNAHALFLSDSKEYEDEVRDGVVVGGSDVDDDDSDDAVFKGFGSRKRGRFR